MKWKKKNNHFFKMTKLGSNSNMISLSGENPQFCILLLN